VKVSVCLSAPPSAEPAAFGDGNKGPADARGLQPSFEVFAGRHDYGTIRPAKLMNLFEIKIGRKYKRDRPDDQYFATVREKQ
jgi:hypothetical protein